MDTRKKIFTADKIANYFGRAGSVDTQPIIARGFFDILTPDHCDRLLEAKQPEKTLVVVVYSDENSKKTILDERTRAELAASMAIVDIVVILPESKVSKIVKAWNASKNIDMDTPPVHDLVADVLKRYGSDHTRS